MNSERRSDSSEELSTTDEYPELEKILSKYKYDITSKLLTQTSDNKEAAYVGAINDLGDELYIELDIDGALSVNKSRDDIFSTTEEFNVPNSLIEGSLSTVGHGISGIALTCKNNICIVHRDITGSSAKTNKRYYSRLGDKCQQEKNILYFPYPVVKMSDIKENVDLVRENVNKKSKLLRKLFEEHCHQNIEILQDSLEQLNEALNQFIDSKVAATKSLSETMKELISIKQEYEDLTDLDEQSVKNKKLVLRNIQKRHELKTNLLSMCQVIASKKKDIDSIICLINSYTDHLDEEYSDLDRLL